MKRFEVLVSRRASNFVESLKRDIRRQVYRRIDELDTGYYALSDYEEYSPEGILLNGTIVDTYAIEYWIDFSDEHIKVLRIFPADEREA